MPPRRDRATLAATAGALAGLAMGYAIGRTQPVALSTTACAGTGEARAETREATERVARPAPVPREDPAAFRIQMREHLPTGDWGSGFSRALDGRDAVAQLSARGGRVAFDLTPAEARYAVTAVARASGEVRVGVALNDTPLGHYALSPRWSFVSVEASADDLKRAVDELSLTPEGPATQVLVQGIAIAPIGDRLSFRVGQPAARGHVVDGFSSPGGNGETTIWSTAESSLLAATLAPAPGAYRLGIEGYAYRTLVPLEIEAELNGESVGSVQFEGSTATRDWSIPAGALRDGVNSIRLSYAATARPSDVDSASRDSRHLALRFYGLALEPR